jgi:HlyD family secretion protein
LFQISNQDSIEVVVDLLTQDAVSITAGDDVDITGWGGDFVIKGRVRYIEPEAFTKFSALGVEEQRVNVIIDLLDPPANLGAEYRVEVAIVVWESESELTVPTSSLFQRNDGWNVFAIVEQKVELRAVEIGNRNKEFAQINSGLNAGDVVVQYPSDLIQEGIEVTYD